MKIFYIVIYYECIECYHGLVGAHKKLREVTSYENCIYEVADSSSGQLELRDRNRFVASCLSASINFSDSIASGILI